MEDTNLKTIGFTKSRKNHEQRRALLPFDLANVKHVSKLYFETGYGDILGYSDNDYLNMGVNVVGSDVAYKQDIVCTLKAPEKKEHKLFSEGQTLFCWIHAVQGRNITNFLLNYKMTGIAWEKMFENGRHVFWRNNELAGEAAVCHAFLQYGLPPYECCVAVVGNGNTARGAVRILEKMGASTRIYDSSTVASLRSDLHLYNVIINCVLWDVFRKDRIIYREDLKRMKTGSMIIDVSCDENLEIETSRVTTMDKPIYFIDGVLHYAIDHTATLFWKSASISISQEIRRYIDDLVEENANEVLNKATIVKDGIILDQDIIKYQNR